MSRSSIAARVATAGGPAIAEGPIIADADLVTAARIGDRDALSELFARHAHAAMMVAGRSLSCPADVDDAVAEGFTRVIERLDTLRDPACFRGFLLTCVRNVARDRHRGAARVVGGQSLEERAHPSRGVEAAIEAADDAARVLAAVDGLPVRQRHALRRFFWDEVPVKVIAGELGLSPNATTQLLFRAKANLARRAGGAPQVRRSHPQR